MEKTVGMRAVLVAICLALCGMEFCPAVTCDVCVVGGGKKCGVRQLPLDELKSLARVSGDLR